MERRLAAILAADVVGYSRLMGEDEAGTLERLKSLRKELVQPKITEHKGRIVKLMGDGLLAEFPSVVEAVQCAVDIQQAVAALELDLPEEQRISLRIGVNLGDVIVEGSDIYGDGVNVAARLEGLADPGGICISGPAFDTVDGKLDTDFEDTGEQQVKNIAKPVRVYRWTDAVADLMPGTAGAEGALPLPEKPSIAVLPFANMSRDPDQEFFADGITEDIITALSRNHWYHVTARNSTFAYKGQSPDIREVAKALGVWFVLEGSVRKGGDRVRITTQLIDAETGNHVWADRFDRRLDNAFAIQDEIAHRVASILGETIWQAVAKRISQKSLETYGPYEYVFRAIELVHHVDPEDMAQAKDYCSKALALDPNFVFAHLGLGFCYLFDWAFWDDPSGQALEKSYEHALRLQDLAPEDAQTYRLLSRVFIGKGMIEEARRCVERALNINPDDGDVIANQGVFLLFNEDPTDAIGWFEKVIELHSETPHTVDIMRYWVSFAHFANANYQEAITTLKSVSGLEFIRNQLLGACYARIGEDDQATSMTQALLSVRPHLRVSDIGLCKMFRQPKDQQHLFDALRKTGLPE